MEKKLVLDVEDIQVYLGISRSKAYELVNSGQFHVVRVGRLIKIPRVIFEQWLNGNQLNTYFIEKKIIRREYYGCFSITGTT